MLALHGEGDPTGVGEGFSFVKTSMKGGFQALGQSADDKVEAKRRQQAGGHMYNVAKQQKLYDDDIRWIWEKQKQRLGADVEVSDTEMEDVDEPQAVYPHGRAATPRSSMGTPAAYARHDDDSASQFSKGSVERGEKVLVISRKTPDKWGKWVTNYEKITDRRVIKQYTRMKNERKLTSIRFAIFLVYKAQMNERLTASCSLFDMQPTGDEAMDALQRQKLQQELARVERNLDRREAREKTKVRAPGSPATGVGSPGPSETAENGTPQKGRGKNKDGTARKCANCGQVGHIKTNRKSVSFRCVFCEYSSLEPKGRGCAIGAGSALADSYSEFVL